MKPEGTYVVTFKNPNDYVDEYNFFKFIGVCENFIPTGKCAFKNENNQMLIVHYDDIVQMRLK